MARAGRADGLGDAVDGLGGDLRGGGAATGRPGRTPGASAAGGSGATGVIGVAEEVEDTRRLVLQLRGGRRWRCCCALSTANFPITRAVATWLLPLAMSSGRSEAPSKSRPIGA